MHLMLLYQQHLRKSINFNEFYARDTSRKTYGLTIYTKWRMTKSYDGPMLGTVFMAGSTLAVTAAPPLIWLCVLLAIPGFVGWAAPYFLYQTLVKKRTAIVIPLIEQKQDEIYELCQKGSELH